MVKKHEFDDVQKEINEAIYKVFEKESRDYFEKFKKLKEADKFSGANGSYDIHLQSTRSRILNEAYNGHIEA